MRKTILLVLTAISAAAQVPDKFTNLKVFPADISKAELVGKMRIFSFSLGMRCEGCHVTGAGVQSDFAADTKETKTRAREMMRMVATINNDNKLKVQCVTCLRGIQKPQTLLTVLSEEMAKQDLAAALALYRELRKKYYGGAQYDFTESSLNQLTESLQAQNKIKEAVAFMELNAEVNKLSGWGDSLLAMSHRANGDTAKAIADFTKLVDAKPKDQWAAKQLEELKAGKK